MNKDRKRVLIIGNGFDLCLGRKTSYKDFSQSEFCPKDYPSPLIKHLNDKWNDNLDAVKWYDLENEGSSSNLVVISFLFQLSSSFLILLKVVDMFAF